MELEIQKWVRKTKPFKEEALKLFNEAVECYKVGANRAAFLMSYLAFEKAVQERILNFNGVPNGIKAEEFEKLKNDLENDEQWEIAIFKNVVKENKIMNLPNKSKIQQRLQVYKLTRNSCTHANGEIINDATVEEFWNFLIDNMSKFNINGGKEHLKEALYKSFRDRNENIEKTTDEILDSLVYANLKVDELFEIWDYLYSKLYRIQDSFKIEEFKKFWNKIIYKNDSQIKESLLNFIKSDSQCFSYFYKLNPQILNFLLEYNGGVDFKKEILYVWIGSGELYLSLKNEYWDIVTRLLKNYVHEQDRIDFLKKLQLDIIGVVPTEEQTIYLKEIEFFENNINYLWHNVVYDYNKVYDQLERIDFIIYMIKNGFDKHCLEYFDRYLYHLKTKSKYPGVRMLRDEIEENLLKDREFVLKLDQIIKKNFYSFQYKESKEMINDAKIKLQINNEN